MTREMSASSPARLFRELARMHVQAQRVAVVRGGASSTRCTILTELGRARAISVAELASRLRLDKSWVSRAVEQLVADGAVLRGADRQDRRAVVLTLTARGRRLHRELEALLNAQIEAVFAGLTAGERRRVAEALRVLLGAYSRYRDYEAVADAHRSLRAAEVGARRLRRRGRAG